MPSVGRAATTSRWISALAPTSMPRVGSSRISSCGSVISQRASSTFCWLPPLRLRDRRLRVGRADVQRLDVLGDQLVLRGGAGCGRAQPRAACRARMMFSRTVRSATRPSVLRFSEQNAMPCADGVARGCAARPALPSIGDLAAVGAVGAEQQPGELGAARSRAARPGRPPRPGGSVRSNGAIAPVPAEPVAPAAAASPTLARRRSAGSLELARGRPAPGRSSAATSSSCGSSRGQVLADQAAVAQHGDPVGRSRRPGRGSAMTKRIAMPSSCSRRITRNSCGDLVARPGWRWARRGSAPWPSMSMARAMATSLLDGERVASRAGAVTSMSRSSRSSSSAAAAAHLAPAGCGRSGGARGR